MMNRFQTLLSNSTCAAIARVPWTGTTERRTPSLTNTVTVTPKEEDEAAAAAAGSVAGARGAGTPTSPTNGTTMVRWCKSEPVLKAPDVAA